MSAMMRRWPVGPRLVAVFALLLLVLGLQTAGSTYASFSTDRMVDQVRQVHAVRAAEARAAREAMVESASATSQYLLLLDFPQADDFRKAAELARQRHQDTNQALQRMAAEGHLGEELKGVQDSSERFFRLQQRVLDFTAKQKTEEALGLWVRDSGPFIQRQKKAYDTVVAALQQGYDGAMQAVDQGHQRNLSINFSALALAVALTVVMGLALQRSIVHPLREAVEASEALARGDLRHEVTPDPGRDEAARVLTALRGANLQLRQVVGRIAQAADSMQTASHEIASGNQDLSQRTEQQAAHLQKAVSSMTELADAVVRGAQSARQAREAAGQTAQAASGGGQAVTEAVHTMEEIHGQSRRIKDIIGAIDGIAFQTNILALNAAVEAARAGEQGRGFAVVAAEVRQLAQRSAQAAREIGDLISASVQRVDDGSGLVRKAGQTIGDVVQQVQQVSDLISTMADSATAQSDGISNVNHMLSDLDSMTQRNAALVEQSAAATASLRQMAQELSQSVAAFQLQGAARRVQEPA